MRRRGFAKLDWRLNYNGRLAQIVGMATYSPIDEVFLLLKVQPMIFSKSFARFFFTLMYYATGSSLCAQQANVAPLLTVAESSEYRQTSTSAEVESYVRHYAQTEHVNEFSFGKTVEGREMIGAIVSRQPFKVGDRDSRLRILLLGNIHSGECSGKEALLIMLRKLSLDPKNAWLDNMVIVFTPNYNADGNDRMGLGHRPGQIGPERGMGLRARRRSSWT